MKCRLYRVFLIVGLLFLMGHPAQAATVDLNKLVIRSEPHNSVEQLYRTSDLVLFGWFDSDYKRVETPHTLTAGKLVNYIQVFHVKKAYKGDRRQTIKVISTGVEPLPKPKDPLNKLYPGVYAEGEYVCFFKKINDSTYYQINGGWQGTYPFINNHILSLEGAGFKELSGITLKEFNEMMKKMNR